LTILKIFFTIAPFVWIFRQIHLSQLRDALARFDWHLIPLIVLIFILQLYFFQSYRWWLLLRAFLPQIPYLKILNLHAKGLFYSLVLPTSAAQDFVRALLLTRKGNDYDYRVVWGSTGITKLFGILTQLMLGVIGIVLIHTSLPSWIIQVLVAASAVILLTTFMFFSKKMTRHLGAMFTRLLPAGKIMTVVKSIRQGIYIYKEKPRQLLQSLFVALVMNIVGIVNASLIFKGITGHFFFWETLAFLPCIELLVVSLPITPSGIGIRELLLSFFLSIYLKLPAEEVGLFVLIAFSANLLRLLGSTAILYETVTKALPVRKKTDPVKDSK
jgi:uncharacterized protein (TIRG00374 family)